MSVDKLLRGMHAGSTVGSLLNTSARIRAGRSSPARLVVELVDRRFDAILNFVERTTAWDGCGDTAQDDVGPCQRLRCLARPLFHHGKSGGSPISDCRPPANP